VYRLWLLKNSFRGKRPKKLRAKMPYKRLSRLLVGRELERASGAATFVNSFTVDGCDLLHQKNGVSSWEWRDGETPPRHSSQFYWGESFHCAG